MSFKPGKVVAALKKVVPDVGTTMLTALKTEWLSKDELTIAEVVACLTNAGVPPAKVFDVRAELNKGPRTAAASAPAAPIVCAPEDVVVALTEAVLDVDEAILDAVKTELLVMDELMLAEAVVLLLGCGVSPAQVFDVREELASRPSPALAEVPPSTPVRCMPTHLSFVNLECSGLPALECVRVCDCVCM
jgi:hypothetical protein